MPALFQHVKLFDDLRRELRFDPPPPPTGKTRKSAACFVSNRHRAETSAVLLVDSYLHKKVSHITT